MLSALFTGQDNRDDILDKICGILAAETANLQTLAVAASADPLGWKWRVFRERSRPWEMLRSETGDELCDDSPIVNVSFSSYSADKSRGNTIRDQPGVSRYFLDVYGYGAATKTSDGHSGGDDNAARACAACVKNVRNVIMAAEYQVLELPAVVNSRWVDSIDKDAPDPNQTSAECVVVTRIVLSVDHQEGSPQVAGEPLETIAVDVSYSSTGEVVASLQFGATDWSE